MEMQRCHLLEALGMSSRFLLCQACCIVEQILFVNHHYYYNSKLQKILSDLMCSISHWDQSVSTESCSDILLSDLERIVFFLFCNVGSIPLDPSLTQSLEGSQAFIDLFPDSPTQNVVKMIISKLVQMESNGEQWSKEQVLFSKMVPEHVAFIQLDKCDWDGQVINHWIDSLQCQSLMNQTSQNENCNNKNWKILSWSTNKSSELWCEEKWRTVWSLLKYIYTHMQG